MSRSYFQDFAISEIIPRLWVGNRFIPERDYSIVRDSGIGAIVSLVEERCEELPDIEMLHCPITDGSFIPAPLLGRIFSFVQRAMQRAGVLIYCSAGMSRSAGVTMGVIMAQKNCSWEQANELFDQKRFSWVCKEVRESVQGYFSNQCQSNEFLPAAASGGVSSMGDAFDLPPQSSAESKLEGFEDRRLLYSDDARALEYLEKETGITLSRSNVEGWSSRGYKVRDSRIVGLGLCNMGLRAIPDGLSFPRLEFLDLSGNLIESIPNAFFDMPDLVELHLNNNRILRLPDSFGLMRNLKELCCQNNLISRIPRSIGGLRGSLIYMSLGANRLDVLPEEIGELHNLCALNLHSNRLCAIPDSFGNLCNLVSLALGNNRLEWLPGSVARFDRLQRLNIGMNRRLALTEEQVSWLNVLEANGCLVIRD